MHQDFYGIWSLYQIWITFSYSYVLYITNIHNSYDKIGISTLLWHRAKVYFTCIKPLRWLITVLNMNKIHWFISDIWLQTYKIYEIMDINDTFWQRAKVYFTCINPYCGWLLYQIWTKWTPFSFEILQQKYNLRKILQ